jgi:hypothetical protein
MLSETEARLDAFIAQLRTNPEYGYMIRKLLEPLADSIFAATEYELLATNGADTASNGHSNGSTPIHVDQDTTSGLREIPAQQEILPSKVTAALASEVGKILLGSGGWVGPLSLDYIQLCEFNW